MAEVARYLLTEMEREFFASWLEAEAVQGEATITEMRKLSVSDAVVRRHVAEVAAERIVAAKLRSTLID